MSKLWSVKQSIQLCVVLILCGGLSAHATTLVTINQSGDIIIWQITGNNFVIDEINLVITGSDETTTTISGCTSSPLTCSSTFNTNPTFNTDGLSTGVYNWGIELIPLIGEFDCDSPSDVRDAQGGFQGLTDGAAPTFEEDYITCLINAGLLPSDNQELFADGNFTIASSEGLIVPEDQNSGTPDPDNNPPIALCMDVTVEGSDAACSVSVDINDGSTDTDGTLISLIQSPIGPYGLGDTNVTLTVTDNLNATSSCSAVVTVTDSLAPVIECPVDNTMTPPSAPATFTAIASDTCSTPTIQVTSYDCYRFNRRGRRIDTNDSCEVTLSNDSITVDETSGVDSFIDWTVEAADSTGNSTESVCTIEVLHPNS
ncbi:MAG: hypothetical protein JKX98_08895 [Alcanivoracaceae bacterium]|nr:hypothetical protein [Alcanivoracaceae bacterium]